MKKYIQRLLALILALILTVSLSLLPARASGLTGWAAGIERISSAIFQLLKTMQETIAQVPQPVPLPVSDPGTKEFPSQAFTYEGVYIYDGKTMPYVLFKPSIAQEYESLPLILWLHGAGERDRNPEKGWQVLTSCSFPEMITSWPSQKFNAYVVCPYLTGEWASNSWGDSQTMYNVLRIVNKIKENYNVDPNRVVIMGHSLGGEGVFYYAKLHPEIFRKAVTLSPYHPYGTNLADIHIPIRAYCGNLALGEGEGAVQMCNNEFIPAFGEEKCFFLDSDHSNLPVVALSVDADGNGRSDLMEWLLTFPEPK